MRRHSRRGLTVRLASLIIIFLLYICMLPVVPRTSTHAQGGIRPEIAVIAPGAAYRQLSGSPTMEHLRRNSLRATCREVHLFLIPARKR